MDEAVLAASQAGGLTLAIAELTNALAGHLLRSGDVPLSGVLCVL